MRLPRVLSLQISIQSIICCRGGESNLAIDSFELSFASAAVTFAALTLMSRATNCALIKSRSTLCILEYSMRKVSIGAPLSASSFLSAVFTILGRETRPILVASVLFRSIQGSSAPAIIKVLGVVPVKISVVNRKSGAT